jgi:putative DNA primase/helicase
MSEATTLRKTVNDLCRHFSLIPVVAGEKRAAIEWAEYQRRRPTAAELRAWFSRGQPNLAIVCGEVSGGLAVLDVDDPALADRIVDDVALQAETTMVRTPRRGIHVYVIEANTSRSGPLVPGVADLKAGGGYVLVPPSVVGGREYVTLTNSSILSVENAREWAIGLLRAYDVEVEDSPAKEAQEWSADGVIPQGTRNQTLISLAGTMRRRGMGQEAITAALLAENAARCRPPLPEEEVRTIARSAARYEPAEGLREISPPAEHHAQNNGTGCAPDVRETDLGNAERLVRRHGAILRYVPRWGWLHYDGRRWSRDVDDVQVTRLAQEAVRAIYAEAAEEGDEERRKKLAKHAADSERGPRIAAMIGQAKALPEVSAQVEEFDRDPLLLNVAGGTIDLRTGSLRPHNPQDYLTKLAPVDYNPDAAAPTWERFLAEITGGNAAVTAFLKRREGCAATGDAGEQVVFLDHGWGANGKSTYHAAIREVLGDYAQQADASTFLTTRGQRVPNDLARLAGVRRVTVAETEAGRRLAEGLVKQVSGGDAIPARFLFREFFEFVPAFKVFLVVNHRPLIRGTDHAIWRRIRLTPFTVTIPEKDRDSHLLDKLRAEADGILAWIVQGSLAWQREGLNPPQEVLAATDEYRREQDVLERFMNDCCLFVDGEWTSAGSIREGFEEWAKEEGLEPKLDAQGLAEKLRQNGCERVRRKGRHGWSGITLPEDAT